MVLLVIYHGALVYNQHRARSRSGNTVSISIIKFLTKKEEE
jgi:hypothetical protein